MRIIAGKYRSRVLKTLEGMNTRPMTDRMKESIFNTIGPYFDGLEVLDLFGGSGALTLETISRGAKHAFIIDNNREAMKIINSNVNSLGEDKNVSCFLADYKVALKKLKDYKFDIIFLDPPYRMNIVEEIVGFILDNNMLNDNGYIVCQYVKGNVLKKDELKVIKNYAFGNSEVLIYQK